MKKFIFTIILCLFLSPMAQASCSLPFVKTDAQKQKLEAVKEIKNTLKIYENYENDKDLDGLKTLYTDEYITADAFPRNVYFDIIVKTWERYSDVQHKLKIKRIDVNGEYALVEAEEIILGKTTEKIEDKTIDGDLRSVSNVIYYLHKNKNQWKFLSDYVVDEQTFLIFDEAKDLDVTFFAPNRILADKEYVATLDIQSIPRNALVIATIGQEKIIYPHVNAEEVYRKIPNNGILERVFKSNKDNLNEYVVATYCLTKPRLTENNQIETLLTGVGYVINRVNVVPENKFITVSENGEKEKK